jgi:zinc protease
MRIIGRSTLPMVFLGAFLMSLAARLHAQEKTKEKPPEEKSRLEKVTTVEGITEYKMSNGLRVLLFPDNSKPLVTVNLTVFVGSRHEGYGETGMAHLLEHLLFKGTPTFPKIPKALADHGAGDRYNASTWVDRTNYYETMPATDENLEFGIKLEADRLVNSYVKREDLISEMTVVRNEFEMGENEPTSILSQRMMANAFEWHNYGKSTIGNRSDIERVPIDNLQAFYKKYYRVDNSMLVVAGQYDEKKTLEYIEKYFGVLKAGKEPIRNTYTEEPAQDGERTVALRRVGTVGAIGVVYHIPAGAHPEFAAVQILEDTLTSSPSGRLYKALVEAKKATNLSGSAYGWHDPGAIEITAKVDAKQIEDAQKTMIDTLEGLSKNPITEEEVARSKTRFAKFQEQLLANTDQLAVQLSEWAACGDWRLFFLHRDRIEKVTVQEVNQAAAKYLTRNNRTVGVYYPSEKPERADIPATPKVADLINGYKGRASVAQGEAFDPTPENIEKRVTRGKIDNIQTVFLSKKTRGEMVEVRLNLRFGNEKALQGQNAAVSMLGSLMRRGTKQHTRKELTDELDKLNADLSIGADMGLLSVSLQTKRPNLVAALKLLREILREPSFPEAEFDILKRESRERYLQSKTDPKALAFLTLSRKLAPYEKSDVRYVATLDESLERLDALKLDDVRKLYETQLSAQAGELAIVGDFDPPAATKEFEAIFKDWKSAVEYQRIAKPAILDVKGGTEKILTPDKPNAVYVAGLMAAMRDADPEYAAMEMGNYLLGGGALSSRLSQRVRGDEGLSYGISSVYSAHPKDPSARFVIYAITNPDNMGKLSGIVREEVAKLLKDGVSASELNEGKSAMIQQMKVERSDDGSLASELATGLFLGRNYLFYSELEKRISDLKPDEVQKTLQKVIDPSRLIIVEAGDFKK